MSTIYAMASGGAPSGVAVMRVSGPACHQLLEATIGRVPAPRQATLASIRDRSGSPIDRGLVLWFPAPGSFTGEDVIEFQVHGSRAVVRALADCLGAFDDVRPAEAGEFTRRAFLSGRLDLTEVEGLADLLAAETEAQRRQALAQSEGSLRRLYDGWRSDLIDARAAIEADLDFADEDDIPDSVADRAFTIAAATMESVSKHLGDARRGERLRDGLQVVIVGPPNAGKSSLLNHLARRDVAIVSEEAGTTRDVLEVHLDLAGCPVTLVDTAGLREASNQVEREGIRRALERARSADLILSVGAPDASREPTEGVDCPIWLIDAKSDLGVVADASVDPLLPRFAVSTASGEGIDALVAALGDFAVEALSVTGGEAVPTRERHRVLLGDVVTGLERAIQTRNDLVLAAEHLRRATDALGRLTGRVDVEDLLDRVFSSFCIGK
jgi:tRNA modification GTPase